MPRRRTWLLVLLVIGLRLLTQGWDSGLLSPHPDERQVAFVAEKADGWFADPGFYAYGSLHFQAVRLFAAARGLERRYGGLLRGGRTLSLAASVLALLIGFAVARRAWGRKAAELVLLLGAFVPLDLQQSHFATVEAHHALWVMAALAACWWLGDRGGWLAAVATGAAAGASLAVKVSSLGLTLPVAAVLLLVAQRRGPLRAVRLAIVAAVAAAAAFWLCQPWAFANGRPPLAALFLGAAAAGLLAAAEGGEGRRRLLLAGAGTAAAVAGVAAAVTAGPLLNPAYLRGVGEQVAMVAGRADLPYARVFRHTLPIVYPLRELAVWGVGPALLLAAVAAAAAGAWFCLRRWRRWIAGRWTPGLLLVTVLVAWAVPMASRLATLQVKYLRYWEPLVVPAVLLTAWLLTRLRRPAILRTVVAITAVWGIAYVWAFAAPHPHRTAARWLDQARVKGQTVAFEHWDEHLALTTTGPQVELASYDLPDSRGKVAEWCRRLASADWVVLTSNRVRRTVLVNPDLFPRTGRLYRLLLSGRAGFLPLTTIERGPHLFGLAPPVQLADESFVNYDFPRVVILRRVAEVDPERLAGMAARPLPELEKLGFSGTERQLVDPLPAVAAVPGAGRQLVDLATWVVVFLALGAACWVLFLPLLGSWPDGGAGLALTTGWLGLAWLVWIGAELSLWPAGRGTVTWLYLVVSGAAAVVGWRRRSSVCRAWARRRRGIVAVAAATALVGLLFLALRASNPAIFWGEKPMDLSFLNAFLRSPSWPPGEPWMAGLALHYYYFGDVLAAVPILLSGAGAAVGYNLMAATVPALAASVLACLGLLVARHRGRAGAWLFPVLVLLTGNLAWPFLLGLARSHRWFDLWWATSRVIPGFAIDEFPLWTAVFADLHAHFLALPVILAALAWGWWTVRAPARRWVAGAVLCGVAVAVLAATNPWDIVVLTATLGTATLGSGRRPMRGIVRLAAAATVSVVAAAPFLVELAAWLRSGVGGGGVLLTRQEFAPAWAVLRHFGVFLLPLAVGAALVAGRRLLLAIPAAGLGVAAGLAFHSTAAALALAAAMLFVGAWSAERDGGRRLAWLLAGLGMLLVAAAERFTLIDRMNTLFKTYNGVWILLAAATAIVLLRGTGRLRVVVAGVWLPLQLVALVNLPLGAYQGWAQPKTRSPRPTLDGEAYLPAGDRETWFLARTLNAVARPGDVVAEAAGPSYREYTRLSMHTGLPTVVGWEWHLQQRGQDPAEIRARMSDLATLYAGNDPAARRQVLDRYGVRWIAMAGIERRTYSVTAAEPFAGVPGIVEVARSGGARLFAVRSAAAGAATVAAKSALPEGLRQVGRLPAAEAPPLRFLALGGGGAVAVLADGSVLRPGNRATGTPPRPPCELLAATVWREAVWGVCRDGAIVASDGERWRRQALLPGTTGLAAASDDLWAWGTAAVRHSRDGRRWRKAGYGPATALAVAGRRPAWSDGPTVTVAEPAGRRTLSPPPADVRSLAWLGDDLWALTADGLFVSAGTVMPWRAERWDGFAPVAVAGDGARLWVAAGDGRIGELVRPSCASPWNGGRGEGRGRLAEPRGIALAPAGWMAVADTRNHRIQLFTRDGGCLGVIGGEGEAPGQFNEPSDVAIGADGVLAVADTWNGRVQLVNLTGPPRVVAGGLFSPRAVLWGPAGELWVADTGNSRAVELAPPNWEPRRTLRFPGPVSDLAWAGARLAAAVPAAGVIVLVDPASGRPVAELPVPGWAERSQQEGRLLALPGGDLLASAPAPGELWRVDPAGTAPPRRVRQGLTGLTAMARADDGTLVGSLTWENRLVRIRLAAGDTPP